MAASAMRPQPFAPDMPWLEGLPHRSMLELGAYDSAPRVARGHVGNVLREWSLREFVDVAVLVVSELISNSVAATSEVQWAAAVPPVRLWLCGQHHGL
jgi:hypothetical protein